MFSEEARTYLEKIVIPIRLSAVTPSGWPIGVSLWYFYENGSLYCATRETAKIVQYLVNEPRCAYEVSSDQPPYCGLRGQAISWIDRSNGAQVLTRLIIRYLGSLDTPLSRNLLKNAENEVAIRITPTTVYSWNFTSRMESSIQSIHSHPCP